jgi:hypothetical protein
MVPVSRVIIVCVAIMLAVVALAVPGCAAPLAPAPSPEPAASPSTIVLGPGLVVDRIAREAMAKLEAKRAAKRALKAQLDAAGKEAQAWRERYNELARSQKELMAGRPAPDELREMRAQLEAAESERPAVLEKLRAEEPLSEKEKKIHDEGLVTVLKQIHDDLDAAVFEAYGWGDLGRGDIPVAQQDGAPVTRDRNVAPPLPFADRLARKVETAAALEQELLTRLVALNHERAAEEKRGLIRWLRPEYQRGGDLRSPTPTEETPNLPGTEEPLSQSKINNPQSTIVNRVPWPPGLAAQVAEIQKLLPATGANAMAISACFGKRSKPREAQIAEILETLRSLGKLE